MTNKRADPERLSEDIVTFPRYYLWDMDRDARHEAWSEIFRALGVIHFPRRLQIAKRIHWVISRYHYEKLSLSRQKPATLKKWAKDIEIHATALRDLVKEHPVDFGGKILERYDISRVEQTKNFINLLDRVAATGAVWASLRSRPGRPSDIAFAILLLADLSRTYTTSTGREPGLSRHPDTGSPGGPFFRFVRGVCLLGGINKTDEAIAEQIKKWVRQIR